MPAEKKYESDRVSFTWATTEIPTREEVINEQRSVGFDVCGYGGPNDLDHQRDGIGGYVTTWWCHRSCD